MFGVLPTGCPFLDTHDAPYILQYADEEIARLNSLIQFQEQSEYRIRTSPLKDWIKGDQLNAIAGSRINLQAQIAEIRRVVTLLKEGAAAKAAQAGALLAQQVLAATRQA